MGSTAHVLVIGPEAESLVGYAVARLDDLERKWSRFRPTSEISRANALPDCRVVVSPETLLLVQRSVEGWTRSGGAFDPTVLAAVAAAGYDRDFSSVAATAAALDLPGPASTPGCSGIVCDERVGTITLPAGVTLDPGGIGKGLAADVVTAELMSQGAHGALVNVGGDLRVRGDGPDGPAWPVGIENPVNRDRELLRVGLVDGAIATSSRARRCWHTAAGPAHHLIDPRTGHPASGTRLAVTAVAGEAWWAEVVCKAVFLDPGGVESGTRYGARVVIVEGDGSVACDPALVGAAA
jgi:FAD:protein FMN transferase